MPAAKRPTLLTLAGTLAIAVPAAAQRPDTAAAPLVEDVRIAGVEALDPDTIRAAIATRATYCRSPALAPVCALFDWRWAEQPVRLNRVVLERDVEAIRALYAARGYPRAQARAEVIPRAPDRVAVRFVVEEGPAQVVRSVEVRGRERLPPGVELPAVPLRTGVPYSEPRLRESQRRIAARLADAGYPFAQVEVAADIQGDSVDLVLEVAPGPRGVFGPAEISAEAPLSARDVRERLAFRPGDPFDPAALQRSLERLYALPLVERVAVTPVPAAEGDSVVVARFVVETRRAQGVEADVTVSGTDCLGGALTWAGRYLFGAPRVVSISAGASNLLAEQLSESLCSGTAPGEFAEPNYLLRAEWSEPVGPDTWLNSMVALERLAYARAYVRRGVRARLALARQLGGGWGAELGYAPEWSGLETVRPLYCVLRGSCAAPLPDALDGRVVLAPVEVSASWAPLHARRPPPGPLATPSWMLPLQSRWLYSARASLSAAGALTLSEFTYARLSAEAVLARVLGRRSELASRVRFGALANGSTLAPPQARLYGGGPLGVRGVSPNLLGPEYLVLRGGAEDLPCEIRPDACAGLSVDPDQVLRRPLGGELLAEASLEGRHWISRSIQLAAFVDAGGVVGERDLAAPGFSGTEWLITPGLGALVLSPFGPVRVDVAYNPGGQDRYPLVARDPDGPGFVYLGGVSLEPSGDAREDVLDRLRVQFYMGLPF